MTTATAITYVTAEDLLRMPDGDRFELWDGELKERCVGSESNAVTAKINRVLGNFAEEADAGVYFTGELSLQIVPGRPNRIPRVDGAFVANGRLPGNRPPKGHLTVPPDLVLEVVSPHDTVSALSSKTQLLLECGVRLIWVVDPEARIATIYRQDGRVSVVGESGALDGESVLPGFTLPLASVLPPRDAEPSL